MRPAEAIRMECKYCMNDDRFNHARCDSLDCKLKDKSIISPLKRIKAHCSDCADDVKSCDGILLHSGICNLYEFRLGHDPSRKGKGNADSISKFKFQSRASSS